MADARRGELPLGSREPRLRTLTGNETKARR